MELSKIFSLFRFCTDPRSFPGGVHLTFQVFYLYITEMSVLEIAFYDVLQGYKLRKRLPIYVLQDCVRLEYCWVRNVL